MPNDLISRAKGLKWTHWLERPYNPFIASLTFAGVGRKYYEIDGLNGFDDGFLYQAGDLYYCEEKREKNRRMIGEFVERVDIFRLTEMLGLMHAESLKKVEGLIADKIDHRDKLGQLREISRGYLSFLWITGPLEEYYGQKIKAGLSLHVQGDVEAFMAAASPSLKKTAYERMQDDLRQGVPAETVRERYGWSKSRDGFTDFYTIEEIEDLRGQLKPQEKETALDIPAGARQLVDELRELVFFRTDRTDKFYEILGVSRPIYEEVAQAMGVSFKELARYDVASIIAGTPKRYSEDFSYLFLDGEEVLQEGPILDFAKSQASEIKGTVAYPGLVRGRVKVVKHPTEVGKVEAGDVLVTQMTLPSFLLAMNKAAAFVTDEGSITCHAAIIAREMHKPCIIGTKIATKVLHDGDEVEVDATQGVVKIIKRVT